jgi:Extensin-like protein C-terminus
VQRPYIAPHGHNSPPPAPPVSLTPPGIELPLDDHEPGSYASTPPKYDAPSSYSPPLPRPADGARPLGIPRSSAPAMTVPLGPAHVAPLTTGTVTASVTPAATLACPLVSALDQWVTGAVQPSALRWFGQQVVEIRQISAYSCRGMNGNSNARISEHAFGNALDVAAFTLADGRKVTVKDGWHGSPEEQGFLRDIEAAACAQFSTVLAPGSNVYHYDHIHVDLMRRASGSQICNPAPIPGDVVAAQARARLNVTGSIGSPSTKHLDYGAEPDDVDDDRPHGLPVRH